MRFGFFYVRVGCAVGHLKQEGEVLRWDESGDADVEFGFTLLPGTVP